MEVLLSWIVQLAFASCLGFCCCYCGARLKELNKPVGGLEPNRLLVPWGVLPTSIGIFWEASLGWVICMPPFYNSEKYDAKLLFLLY